MNDDRPPRLLLVDDSRHVVDALLELFVADGWHVDVARDGAAALHTLRSSSPPPDVVLADVVMPPPTGPLLLDAVAADPRLAGVPVVLLSAYLFDPADCAELMAKGAADCLSKDTPPAVVLAKVRALVRRP